MSFVRALETLVPPPDLMFILTAPVAVIRSRKDEVSANECRRQLDAYRALAARYPQATMLDGTRPPSALAHQARRLISRHIRGNQ
jgi:thymidylate kinase